MKNYIIVGVDMSDATMMLAVAHNDGAPVRRSFENDASGWEAMVRALHAQAKQVQGAEVVLAYEAGPHGMGLCDFLLDRGVRASVLAPTRLPHTPKSRKQKTDPKDAERLLEVLRGHLLAGNTLPSVWLPDATLRQDREVVRGCLDASGKVRKVRQQIQSLLKRYSLKKPKGLGGSWTQKHRAWLRGLAGGPSPLGGGAQTHLQLLLTELAHREEEHGLYEEAVAQLALEARYRAMVEALDAEVGVGVLMAMVFITELGDPRRFRNRRQVAAYFGLAPSSYETGERSDCKGHITRQGSGRVRGLLCQAYLAEMRTDPEENARYTRHAERAPKPKIAVVAGMRRKAVRMWHVAMAVPPPSVPVTPPSRPPEGGKHPVARLAPPEKHQRATPAVGRRRAG